MVHYSSDERMILFCITFSAASKASSLGIMALPLECLAFLFAEQFDGMRSFLLPLLTASAGPGNSNPRAGDPALVLLAGYALCSCSSAAAKPCKVVPNSLCLMVLDTVARERASFASL